MLKKILVILYLVVVVVMAAATFAEHLYGMNFYAEWWFTALWALLAAVAVVYFLSRRIRRLSVVVLHFSFLVILLGALLTHLTASQGILHLRPNETATAPCVRCRSASSSTPLSLSVIQVPRQQPIMSRICVSRPLMVVSVARRYP